MTPPSEGSAVGAQISLFKLFFEEGTPFFDSGGLSASGAEGAGAAGSCDDLALPDHDP